MFCRMPLTEPTICVSRVPSLGRTTHCKAAAASYVDGRYSKSTPQYIVNCRSRKRKSTSGPATVFFQSRSLDSHRHRFYGHTEPTHHTKFSKAYAITVAACRSRTSSGWKRIRRWKHTRWQLHCRDEHEPNQVRKRLCLPGPTTTADTERPPAWCVWCNIDQRPAFSMPTARLHVAQRQQRPKQPDDV